MPTLRITIVALLLTFATNVLADGGEEQPRLLMPNVLPSAHELANPDLYYPAVSERYVPPPPVWGAPPPMGSVRPGEFEPLDATVISITGASGTWATMWTQMVDTYTENGHVMIIANSDDREAMQGLFDTAGIDAGGYSWLNYPINSIWVRDYGPEFARAPDGERYIFDADYSTRPLDDAVPILMGAGDWLNSDGSQMEVNSSDHMLSGGNVMSDGAGTCFFSDIVYGYEKPGSWSNDDVDAAMAEYLGCEQMVVLKPICLDMTGHIDLYAKVLTENNIVLIEWPVETHFDGSVASGVSSGHCSNPGMPNDYQDQEDNLATIMATTNLSGDPWVVTRMPIPEPYNSGGWIYRSYMNSEIMNNWIAMPSFYDPHGDETAQDLLDMEALAIAAYETGLPGVNVVAIDTDHMNGTGGAIHCISHDIPEEDGSSWAIPDSYCGDGVRNGDEECDGDDFGGDTCSAYDSSDVDLLFCNVDCTVDSSECPSEECGNGVIDDGEECDPCSSDLPECASMELGTGMAGCSLNCVINWYNCTDVTPCQVSAALDPKVLCCPDVLPTTCADDDWPWPDADPLFGCCSADLTAAYWCNSSTTGSPGISSCGEAQHCQYISGDDWDECGVGAVPVESAPDIDCDVDGDSDSDTDADVDGGPTGGGGGDDGCGCTTAGASGGTSLFAAVMSALLG